MIIVVARSTSEDIFELSVMLLVEYICVDYLPEDDPNDFYGEEYTCYLLMESELDDFLTLIAQIETLLLQNNRMYREK